jgi:hypothetical protein
MRDIVEIARLFLFVREAQAQGQNRGLRVEAIQHWSAGQFGDSWCAEFATMMLDIAFAGDAPIPRQGGVEAIRQLAATQGWLTDTPAVGDLVVSLTDAGVGHHIGIVTSTDPLTSIAGNTSEDGTSANGDRVAEHGISSTLKTFIHYPRS